MSPAQFEAVAVLHASQSMQHPGSAPPPTLLSFKASAVVSEVPEDSSEEWQAASSDCMPGLGRSPALAAAASSDSTEQEEEEAASGDDVNNLTFCEDELEEEEQSEEGPARMYCKNCTGDMQDGQCFACGHHARSDGSLFSRTADAVDAADAGVLPASRSVALLWDERMELHEDAGSGQPHPERPDRLRAVIARIFQSSLHERCVAVQCPEATYDEMAAVHTPELIEFIECMATGRPAPAKYPAHTLTSDTYTNQHTYECAKLAAGGAAEVTRLVVQGKAGHGAAIIRPPGHHAESNLAMGFCFLNNAAIAAKVAQANGAQRVLILDWDIHHGNGTQHIFDADPSVLYMSLHRYDHGNFYPGTGACYEAGSGDGEGYTVNVAWNGSGLTNGDYMSALNHVLLPVAYEFNPSVIILSAGFDAADGDPVGGCRLTPECFAHMTALLKAVAPLVLLLEGGYNLSATAASTEACLRVLLGEQAPVLPGPRHPTLVGLQGIQAALQVHGQYWRSLRVASSMLQPAPTRQGQMGLMRPRQSVTIAPKQRRSDVLGGPKASSEAAAGRAACSLRSARMRQVLQMIRARAIRQNWRRHRQRGSAEAAA